MVVGSITVATGSTKSGTPGDITVSVGETTYGDGGIIDMRAGSTASQAPMVVM